MKKIADIIQKSDSVALVIHVNPDADCVGTATALVIALRSMGKKADVFCQDPIPGRLSFLVEEGFMCTSKEKYDVCLCIDVAEEYMMGNVKQDIYDLSDTRCCIDHHSTNKGYADCNYIDAKASAVGEIVYTFIKDFLSLEVTGDMAMRLYAAIASDTGSFRYSNTTSRTHLIAGELMQKDFDAPRVMRILFESKTEAQLRLNAEVIEGLRFYENGKICVAVVDENLLNKYELAFGEADDIASIPRSIVGVEVGVYIKVKGDKLCKASLRSNEYVDVAAIAKALGGGGHIRAAGVTVEENAQRTEEILLELIKKVI